MEAVDEYFVSMPPGYRFRPTDEQLIVEYLKKKVSNQPLPKNRMKDVYLPSYTPDQLTEKYHLLREEEWYFFTPRIKKYARGNRPNRSAGNGFWKSTGADTAMFSNGEIVGFKKSLVFYEKSRDGGRECKTHWLMQEYRVEKESTANTSTTTPVDIKLDEWVLCKIYYNRRHKKHQDAEEERQIVIGNEVLPNLEHDHHQQQDGDQELIHYQQLSNAKDQDQDDHQQPPCHGGSASSQLPSDRGMPSGSGLVVDDDYDNIFGCLGNLPPLDSVLAPELLDIHDPYGDAFAGNYKYG